MASPNQARDMKTASFADWAGIAAFLVGVFAFVQSSLMVGLALAAVAVLLLTYAVPRWRREAVATRRARRIAATQANIYALECELGYEPIRWEDTGR